MTLDQQVVDTVLTAKCTTVCFAIDLVNREKNGEDIKCCLKLLYLRIRYIRTLERWYCRWQSGLKQYLTDDQVKAMIGTVNNLSKN